MFSIDGLVDYQYAPFFADFGPPSLLMMHRFNAMIDDLMKTHPERLHYTASGDPFLLSNSVLYIVAFRMIHLGISPERAYEPVAHLTSILRPFRDASPLPQTHFLPVLACLQALAKAMRLRWYVPSEFNLADWWKYEQVVHGDMNWIIPRKLVAFATPYQTSVLPGNCRVATPRDLIPVFKSAGVTTIVRLCHRFYDEAVFKQAGFKFQEMFFADGSTPCDSIRDQFLDLCESPEVIAVHCKAGLGRTYFFFLTSVELWPAAT
jgi:cell division cycle 14